MKTEVLPKRKRSVADIIDERVQEMERQLNRFAESNVEKPSWNRANCSMDPLKDVRVTLNDVLVMADLPFTKEDSLEVKSIDDKTIEISASTKRTIQLRELGIKHDETELKQFQCKVRVPVSVNMEKMQINFNKGMLRIRIPRLIETEKTEKRRTRN